MSFGCFLVSCVEPSFDDTFTSVAFYRPKFVLYSSSPVFVAMPEIAIQTELTSAHITKLERECCVMGLALKNGFEGNGKAGNHAIGTTLTSSFVAEVVFESHEPFWKSSSLKLSKTQWKLFKNGWDDRIDSTITYEDLNAHEVLSHRFLNIFYLTCGLPITVFFNRGHVFGEPRIRKCMLYVENPQSMVLEDIQKAMWKKWGDWLGRNGWQQRECQFQMIRYSHRLEIHSSENTPRFSRISEELQENNDDFLNEDEEDEWRHRLIYDKVPLQLVLVNHYDTESEDEEEDDDD